VLTIAANVALYRPAVQSSLYSDYYATRAVDGNLFRGHESCTSEHVHYDSWWGVDLGSPMDVARVCVTNDFNPWQGQLNDPVLTV